MCCLDQRHVGHGWPHIHTDATVSDRHTHNVDQTPAFHVDTTPKMGQRPTQNAAPLRLKTWKLKVPAKLPQGKHRTAAKQQTVEFSPSKCEFVHFTCAYSMSSFRCGKHVVFAVRDTLTVNANKSVRRVSEHVFFSQQATRPSLSL